MNEREPDLQATFAEAGPDPVTNGFTDQVMERTDSMKHRTLVRRLIIGSVLAVLAVPLQDFALATAQTLAVQLVQIDGQLIGLLLAPINTVGGLLSMVLLGIRAMHPRLFS